MRVHPNVGRTTKGFSRWVIAALTILGIVIVLMVGFAIATPIVVAVLSPTSNTTSTSTPTSIYSNTATLNTTSTSTPTSTNFNTSITYGNLYHTPADDHDTGYVVINSVDVVNQTSGTITGSYVEQITFAFYTAPSTSTPEIWLYVMNRTGSTATFTPTIIYQLSYSLIITGAAGVQTMTLPSGTLPITYGQYMGVGFPSTGGSCYRMANRDQYYLATSTFSTVPSGSYTPSATGGFAFTFVVRTVGYTSG